MIFSSAIFLFLFLPLILLCYFSVKSIRTKNIVLLIFSIIFYAWGEPVYVFLLMASIVVNWKFGLLVSTGSRQNKKKWLIVSVIVNTGILFVFKYLGFFCSNLNLIINNIDFRFNVSLPIGISFFSFQAMSYVIDVYREDGIAQKKIRNVALYLSLFPQLVAGPIVRYETISEQIDYRSINVDKFSEGVRRFILGLVKKVVYANNFSLIADEVFESAANCGSIVLWIGAISYSLQILFDFSGYSDMAIGLGKMFGFDFLENFDYPYVSRSVTEFWRRWHISLGSWFRDYIYIPLGGNRVTKKKNFFNLFIVWSLTGLWHGANWTFILWGLFYFTILVIEKSIKQSFSLKRKWSIIPHIYTLFMIIIGWVIFRSNSISAAFRYINGMFGTFFVETDMVLIKKYLGEYGFTFISSLVFICPFYRMLNPKNNIIWNLIVDILLMMFFMLSVSYIVKGSYNPFIYFNF